MQFGTGMYKWPNGNIYEGEFRSGKKHGHGNFRWEDQSYYVGSWVDDMMEG